MQNPWCFNRIQIITDQKKMFLYKALINAISSQKIPAFGNLPTCNIQKKASKVKPDRCFMYLFNKK